MTDQDIYATVRMGNCEVSLYPGMDKLMETLGEGTEHNGMSYLSARIKYLKGLLRETENHFAHGSKDDGMNLWSRISDALPPEAERSLETHVSEHANDMALSKSGEK